MQHYSFFRNLASFIQNQQWFDVVNKCAVHAEEEVREGYVEGGKKNFKTKVLEGYSWKIGEGFTAYVKFSESLILFYIYVRHFPHLKRVEKDGNFEP